ncbi:MAG: hypothetical protein KBG28_07400 [Kofleriaceae bacterium]|jgi:anti-anti-sigma regulatory factor/predicted RNA-binding Zn-ribbon protein involved in translation (DUF1610 family)|nr:hypothetical protein [Kofleriaceae bacterium]MBP6839596.1 hypothetical protein [Kofleriaceae bacterium]MBP9203770.1 hypothetical protein [Kofleriaceae bacterium]
MSDRRRTPDGMVGTAAPPGTHRLSVQRSDADFLTLAGVIDETSRLTDLVLTATGRLRVDLGGVTFINSLGVRAWIQFVAEAARAGVRLELYRVSEVMIQQLNMIVAARGRAEVHSLLAPYVCDRCGREESMLIDVGRDRHQLVAGQAPAMTCPECGAAMVFNDFPQRYFLFLSE